VCAEAILDDDHNVAAVIEIPRGDGAVCPTDADCFNDKRVSLGVWKLRGIPSKNSIPQSYL
jgi:hypothetical protein